MGSTGVRSGLKMAPNFPLLKFRGDQKGKHHDIFVYWKTIHRGSVSSPLRYDIRWCFDEKFRGFGVCAAAFAAIWLFVGVDVVISQLVFLPVVRLDYAYRRPISVVEHHHRLAVILDSASMESFAGMVQIFHFWALSVCFVWGGARIFGPTFHFPRPIIFTWNDK